MKYYFHNIQNDEYQILISLWIGGLSICLEALLVQDYAKQFCLMKQK